jgi:uncharacterized protein YggU (UPF0235/DUF167 family)
MTALLTVKVQTRSKNPGLRQTGPRAFRISVRAAPERGRANREVIVQLAEHLRVPPSRLKIVRGETSTEKWIEVTGDIHEHL